MIPRPRAEKMQGGCQRAWPAGPCLSRAAVSAVCRADASAPADCAKKGAHLALRLAQILFVLHHQGERLLDGGGIELAHAERTEAARPVERLGDAGRLAEIELAER